VAQCELGVNRWQVAELHYRILGKARGQVIRQSLSPGRIPCQDERHGCFVLHVPPVREPERRRSPLPGFGGVSIKGFPQSCFGFVACRSFLLTLPARLSRRPGRTAPVPFQAVRSKQPYQPLCTGIRLQLSAWLPTKLLAESSLRIVLQEGKKKQNNVQGGRVKLLRLRLFGRSLGLVQAIQKQIVPGDECIARTAPWVQAEVLAVFR